MLVTLLIYFETSSILDGRANERFEFQSSDVSEAIVNRMRAHEMVLRGGAGLFDSAAPVRPKEAIRVPSMAILLAEDNEVNRLVIRTGLSRRGHRVTMVENGLEAVEAATTADYERLQQRHAPPDRESPHNQKVSCSDTK
jgi:PleD family two-component response regulator